MGLEEAAGVMMAGLDLAAAYVQEGAAVALKSGRPHYEAAPEVLAASNAVLYHALELGADCGCAVQLHAESGPCIDVVPMAKRAGIPVERVVKHFATPDTPLVPSLIARAARGYPGARPCRAAVQHGERLHGRERPARRCCRAKVCPAVHPAIP